jgi:hypothetical protein
MSSPATALQPWTSEPGEGVRPVASNRNRSGAYGRFAAFFVVGSANTGQGCGIAPRLLTRSQRSPHSLPGWLQVSLFAAVVLLLAGWQAPPAKADDEPATTAVADVAAGVTEGAAPSLAPVADADELASGGESPSEAEPHSGPGQELAEPTNPPVAPRAPGGATPAPDRERRPSRPAPDGESRQQRPGRDGRSWQHRPAPDGEPRQDPPGRDGKPWEGRPAPEGEPREHRPTPEGEPQEHRPTPDGEPREQRPTPDAEPPQTRPAPEATKEHPAGAEDVTIADSPAVAQPTAPAGSELEPSGSPNVEPAGRTARVDVPDDGPAPAPPRRARTRAAQAPTLPISPAPTALRPLAHQSAPSAAHPAASHRSVRKHARRPDPSVTRAGGSRKPSRPTLGAPHRRGVPGAASAAAATANGTASPSNAVLSGVGDLAPAGLAGPLPVFRPVLRPMNVAEAHERPG